ncbi:MAG: Hsp20/alpha crystallin family protein [Flavisolibacter sp.]
MAFVRIDTKPVNKSFNNLMDDLFAGIPSILRNDVVTPDLRHRVPVNIRETETEYVLEMIAPGFEKENFKIQLEKNILTVSAEAKNETVNENEKNVLREFTQQSFKRSFTVDEKLDSENIVAKYVNGVLTLNLPKKAEVKEATKNISIL